MQNGLPGTGTSDSGGSGSSNGIGNALGDMVGLGVGLSAMGGIVNMTKDIVNPVMNQVSEIGKTAPQEGEVKSGLVSAWNCTCGKSCITTKFCPECGSPKSVVADIGSWNCGCGQTEITSNFCPNCGAKKPENNGNWTCSNCGQSNISTNFCPNCGNKKGE